MTMAFPLQCILQPALLLAHLSVFAVPAAFSSLPEEITGVLIGLSLIITTLVRFRTICDLKRDRAQSGLQASLLGVPKRLEYTVSATLLMFVIGLTTVQLAVAKRELGGAAVIATCIVGMNMTRKNVVSVLAGIMVAGSLTIFGLWEYIDGYLAACISGFLFQVVAFDCLSLWDHVHQSPLGFNLSALALVTLFVAAATLDLAS